MTVVLAAVAGAASVLAILLLLERRRTLARLQGAAAEIAQSSTALEVLQRREAQLRSELEVAKAEAEAAQRSTDPASPAWIERARLQREWEEVAGPGAELPAGWDGSLQAAIAVELAIIREVTGTPGSLASSQGYCPGGSPLDWAMVLVAGETLRLVSRAADDLEVRLGGEPGAPELTVTARSSGPAPDLSLHRQAASAFGLAMGVEQLEGGFRVLLGPAGP